MQHYKVKFNYSYADASTDYPHSPEDYDASLQDFLEDMRSQGWELVSHGSASSSAHPTWVFRPCGRNS